MLATPRLLNVPNYHTIISGVGRICYQLSENCVDGCSVGNDEQRWRDQGLGRAHSRAVVSGGQRLPPGAPLVSTFLRCFVSFYFFPSRVFHLLFRCFFLLDFPSRRCFSLFPPLFTYFSVSFVVSFFFFLFFFLLPLVDSSATFFAPLCPFTHSLFCCFVLLPGFLLSFHLCFLLPFVWTVLLPVLSSFFSPPFFPYVLISVLFFSRFLMSFFSSLFSFCASFLFITRYLFPRSTVLIFLLFLSFH